MAVTNYYTADNEIFAQETAGQRLDYMPDALGSVVATVDQSKTTQSSARYKPYGSVLASSGLTLPWEWIGALGYLSIESRMKYVRGRFYLTSTATWSTADPLWPDQLVYVYCEGNPVTLGDPSGLGGNKVTQSRPDRNGRPMLPAGLDYIDACCQAMAHKGDVKWYYNQVVTYGPWDPKHDKKHKQRPQYEDAGNYLAGFTARCLGLPLLVAQMGAGLYQVKSGTSRADYLNFIPCLPSGGGAPLLSFQPIQPFGDDPIDQAQINAGYYNADMNIEKIAAKCPKRKDPGGFAGWQQQIDQQIQDEMDEGARPPSQWWKHPTPVRKPKPRPLFRG